MYCKQEKVYIIHRKLVMSQGDTHENSVTTSVFRVRSRFYTINQVDGESVSEWYARVRVAAIPCGFGVHEASLIADKFVTGLQPGLAADKLLGECAIGRPEDLLAVAVKAEETPSQRDICADCGGQDALLLTEIREALKLYKFQSDGRAARELGNDGKNDHNGNVYNEKITTANIKPLDENLWWKNKSDSKLKIEYYNSSLLCKICDVATASDFEKKPSIYSQLNKSETQETDLKNICYNPNCYCSWLIYNENE